MTYQDATKTDDLGLVPGLLWWREPMSASCPLMSAHRGTRKSANTKRKKKNLATIKEVQLRTGFPNIWKIILSFIQIIGFIYLFFC